MISCAIIEDDSNTSKMLSSIVTEAFDAIKIVGEASSIKSGIDLINKTNPGFIFLDINLEDGKSFDILRNFPNPAFKIIFITSYSKYAIEAFKFSALDFVLKPFTPLEITKAIDKVVEQQNNEDYTKKLSAFFHNYTNTTSPKKIILSNADSIHVVLIEDILYAKSDNSYTTFFVSDGREILVSKSLKSFDEKLSPHFFFRIHQKYLINLHQIKKYNKRNDEIVLSNNIALPVSQVKKPKLLQLLKQ